MPVPNTSVTADVSASGQRLGMPENGIYEVKFTTSDLGVDTSGNPLHRMTCTVVSGYVHKEGENPFVPAPGAGHEIRFNRNYPESIESEGGKRARIGEQKALALAMGNALKDLRIYDESDAQAKQYMDHFQALYAQYADADFINAYEGALGYDTDHLLWPGARFFVVFQRPAQGERYSDVEFIASEADYKAIASGQRPVRWKRNPTPKAQPNANPNAGPGRLAAGRPNTGAQPATLASPATPNAGGAVGTTPGVVNTPSTPAVPANGGGAAASMAVPAPGAPSKSPALPGVPSGFRPGVASA